MIRLRVEVLGEGEVASVAGPTLPEAVAAIRGPAKDLLQQPLGLNRPEAVRRLLEDVEYLEAAHDLVELLAHVEGDPDVEWPDVAPDQLVQALRLYRRIRDRGLGG